MDATEIARLHDRFWARVNVRGPNECWEWMRGNCRGYGQVDVAAPRHGNRVRVYAHRFALEEHLGRPLGDGMMALHHCDNPPCVNPAHLYEGTAADNTADMLRRRRGRPRGIPLGAQGMRRSGAFHGELPQVHLASPADWEWWQQGAEIETRDYVRTLAARLNRVAA